MRVCDVAPDGASTRVTYNTFNLSHREGADKVVPLEPGKAYKVRFALIDTALCVRARASHPRRDLDDLLAAHLALARTRDLDSDDGEELDLASGATAQQVGCTDLVVQAARVGAHRSREPSLAPGGRNRVVHNDHAKRETVVEVTDSSGRNRYDEIDLVAEARSTERYSVTDDEPLSATAEVDWTWEFERADWRIRTESRTQVSCTKRDFLIRARSKRTKASGRSSSASSRSESRAGACDTRNLRLLELVAGGSNARPRQSHPPRP